MAAFIQTFLSINPLSQCFSKFLMFEPLWSQKNTDRTLHKNKKSHMKSTQQKRRLLNFMIGKWMVLN